MITLRELTLLRGARPVLREASTTLNPGEKIGLIGRNGAGKSSLFALLTGRLHADTGSLSLPPSWRVAEVAQEMPETDQPATAYVVDGDLPLRAARARLSEAEAGGDGHALADAHTALADAGAFDAVPRAQALLMGLGFRGDELERPVREFSGGWRMRLQLARALMCPSDLLLLDEPTNHLDLDALVWLEAWLQRYEGTLLVISHDRDFLDAVTRVTLHLDDGILTRYSGNISSFEVQHAERLRLQSAAFDKQQDRIAHLQRFIDRFKAKATKARQAQSRVKALERLERIAPVLTQADFSFEFLEPDHLPNPMLVARELDAGYPGGEASEAPRTIVHQAQFSVLPGQRIGVLGANGQGKSTLVKTLAGVLPALSGTRTEGKGLRIGYFAQQELDVLRPEDGPLAHMVRLARAVSPHAREQELRDFLGRFRFTGDMVAQAVGTLSGGEKARLVLAMLVWQRPNLLLLDEPTNHLDLNTREALSLALNQYEGSVLLVSHDRALLREVCDDFWLVAGGRVAPFDGDLDDYQRWLQEQARARAQAWRAAQATEGTASDGADAPTRPSGRDERRAAAAERQRQAEQARPLKKALAELEGQIEALSAEKQKLEEALAQGGVAPAAMAEHGRRLKQVGEDLDAAENRWLETGEALQALAAR